MDFRNLVMGGCASSLPRIERREHLGVSLRRDVDGMPIITSDDFFRTYGPRGPFALVYVGSVQKESFGYNQNAEWRPAGAVMVRRS